MIPKLKLQSAPVNQVITPTEAKDFLRVDGSSEDSRISLLINAATGRLEEYTGLKFISQTWQVFYDAFPRSSKNSGDDWWDGVREGAISDLSSLKPILELPFGTISSFTHFKTYDDADTAYVFSAANYSVDTIGPVGRVALRLGSVWPTTVLRAMNGIEIQAVFGFGANATDVPAAIKQAVLELVSIMFEHRGDELPEIPAQALLLLDPYRRYKIGC